MDLKVRNINTKLIWPDGRVSMQPAATRFTGVKFPLRPPFQIREIYNDSTSLLYSRINSKNYSCCRGIDRYYCTSRSFYECIRRISIVNSNTILFVNLFLQIVALVGPFFLTYTYFVNNNEKRVEKFFHLFAMLAGWFFILVFAGVNLTTASSILH